MMDGDVIDAKDLIISGARCRIAELEQQKEILGKSADERAIAIQELEQQLADVRGEQGQDALEIYHLQRERDELKAENKRRLDALEQAERIIHIYVDPTDMNEDDQKFVQQCVDNQEALAEGKGGE